MVGGGSEVGFRRVLAHCRESVMPRRHPNHTAVRYTKLRVRIKDGSGAVDFGGHVALLGRCEARGSILSQVI